MMNGLNFYHFMASLFLAFVSLWHTPFAGAQTSAQAKDEFEIFAAEMKDSDGKTKPSSSPSPAPPDAAMVPKAETPPETADEKIERLKKEIRANPKNTALFVSLADEFYKKGDNEKVTLLLWKHVDKIDRAGFILLAKAHEKRKESAEMVRALNLLLGKNEKDPEALTLMGNALQMQKKTQDALENYKKAIEINSRYEPAYNGLIDLYEKRNPPNLYELRILYQDMTEQIGQRPQYLRRLCEINTLDDTYEAAITVCKEALVKDPKTADAHVYLGVAYKATGDDKKAEATLKKAAHDFPKSELAQYHYAKVLEEKKNFVDAMRFFKVGTDADPQAARSWLGLATTSFEIRKYDVSLIAYTKACKLDKKNAAAFRKATTTLRNQRNSQWSEKFENASESCTF
ncbi:MAG: tetratricopeptide repeat protein [Bdellovibrio sp.]